MCRQGCDVEWLLRVGLLRSMTGRVRSARGRTHCMQQASKQAVKQFGLEGEKEKERPTEVGRRTVTKLPDLEPQRKN